MREVLDSGTFANLEEFDILEVEPGALTMEALELLIQRCPHLKGIKGLETCMRLTRRFNQKIERRLLARNLDLEITERPKLDLLFRLIL
jgi:hypothetical protein